MSNPISPPLEPTDDSPTGDTSPVIVGIGASAGGLEAIETFFRGVDPECPAVYVLIQHLSPDFESLMGELLERFCDLPVYQAADGMRVSPGRVYLIPPACEMRINGDRLAVTPSKHDGGVRATIDQFLESLAIAKGSKAVAIILSGTGSDGTQGALQVRKNEGFVIVQDPKTAQFDGMPCSAIGAGAAELVLSPEEMPERVKQFALGQPLPGPADLIGVDQNGDPWDQLMRCIRSRRGIDFFQYKQNSVRRRVQRRIGMLQLNDLESYLRLVAEDEREIDRLLEELLIGVTEFFRDSEAFTYVERHVLPTLCRERNSKDPLRIWVAACSTGCEAYTMAMLLEEARDSRPELQFKIFATDVDRGSLAEASRGLFPSNIAEQLGPQRLERFFTPLQNGYEVKRSLREQIVFAEHDLTGDPPFTRIDLVTCRNVLIYFGSELQQRVLHLLGFALRPGGVLFLGPSESLGDQEPDFEVLEPRWKVFRKEAVARPAAALSYRGNSHAAARRHPQSSAGSRILPGFDSFVLLAEQMVASQAAGGLLLNGALEIVHVFGEANGYLALSAGSMSLSFLDLLPAEARTTLSSMLDGDDTAQRDRIARDVRFEASTGPRQATVRVLSMPDRRTKQTHHLVLLGELLEPSSVQPEEHDISSGALLRIEALENELRHSRELLKQTVEELETANEELQSTNEELLASNEELQSTNEELHSVNEELYTVNLEHRRKITELLEMTDDMEHLMRSTDVGTIFLDESLKIRKFTPGVLEFIPLQDQDLGRSLSEIRSVFTDVQPDDLAAKVLAGNSRVERELRTDSGRCVLLRAVPYEPSSHQSGGIVLTLIDLSEIDVARRELALSEDRFRELIEHVEDVFWIAVPDGSSFEYVGPRSDLVLGVSADELRSNPRCWLDRVHPEDRPAAEAAMDQELAKGEFDLEFRVLRTGGDTRWLHAMGFPVLDENGELVRVTGLMRDVTQRKRQEDLLISLTQDLENQVVRDSLTGLLNRRGANRTLLRELDRSSRAGSRLIAAMIDLDDFKRINDSLGHAAGDVALQGVASRMLQAVRPTDVLCRIGGDEFLLLMTETRPAEALQIAERLRAAAADAAIKATEGVLQVTASIGVAEVEPDVVSVEEVLNRTRAAISQSKRSGKNRVSMSGEDHAEGSSNERETVLSGLMDGTLLEAYAQAIYDLRKNEIVGYEMLSRGPAGNYREPYDFFRLSVEGNVLTSVDLRCLRHCIQAANGLGENQLIHVNLFPSTILETRPERLLSMFEQHGGAQRFCLEISEQQFLGDPGHLRERVGELKAGGLGIAIDDVGFGRSSLEALILLEPEVVKVDRKFVHGAATDPLKRRHLERLVGATDALSAKLVAEGIERPEEIELLQELHVELGQGYLFGRPVPVEEAVRSAREGLAASDS